MNGNSGSAETAATCRMETTTMTRAVSQYERQRSVFHPMSGVLGVIQPITDQRSTLESVARNMLTARMAIAVRDNPPQALQLALMQAYQRHRRLR